MRLSNFCGLVLLFAGLRAFSQNNSVVLNGDYIVLNGGNAANAIYFVVNQPSPSGIVRIAGGHIISENQYNYVKWNTGSNTGNYVFPFGVGGIPSDFIPFTFNKGTSGNTDLSISTWSTDPQNMPHPLTTNVGPVTSMTGITDSVKDAIDRFWDIQSPAFVSGDLTFSYLGSENTTSAPTDTFKAQHWNGNNWDPQAGPGNPGVTSGVGTVGPIPGRSAFSPWVLTRTDSVYEPPKNCDPDALFVPTAFSPNGDGQNDLFMILGTNCVTQMNLVIFDRWGEQVFETTNRQKGWDGSYNGSAMNTAVFIYYLNVTFSNGKTLAKKGNLTLLR